MNGRSTRLVVTCLGKVWDFLKEEKFFAMIIPKDYGGLDFSSYANSEVVRTIASRSLVAAVTVMVPNSLGPAELLMQFGTEEQRDFWLPRLADGRELPMLCPDQHGGWLRCCLYGRSRCRLQGYLRRRRGCRHPPELGQALHHPGSGGDRTWPGIQAL